MFSFVVNAVSVVIGSIIGLLFKKLIKKEYCEAVLKAMGLVVIMVGILGVIENVNNENVKYGTIVIIVCIAIGTFIGEFTKIDTHLNNMADKIEKKLNKGSISEGLVTSSILYCVGAMAIIGSLNASLGDPSTIYIKSGLDGVTSIALASTLGFGVALSSIAVLVYQGLLTLIFYLLESIIDPAMIEIFAVYISMVGYILVLGIGINFFLKEKIKIANMLPSIIIAIIYAAVVIWLG